MSALLALVGFVGLCLLVGAAEAALSSRAVQGWYLSLTQPPGTPPAWVFGPIWTVLYIMIGVAGWMVWRHASGVRPLRLWGWQLAANAAWTPAFFGLHSPGTRIGCERGPAWTDRADYPRLLETVPTGGLAHAALSGLVLLCDLSFRRFLVDESSLRLG